MVRAGRTIVPLSLWGLLNRCLLVAMALGRGSVAMEWSPWPRRIEVPHTVPCGALENDWVVINAFCYPLYSNRPEKGLLWYGPTKAPLAFSRQDKRIFVSIGGRPPVVTGVMVTTAADLPILAAELARAKRPITVWASMCRWPAIAALPNRGKVTSIVAVPGYMERDPIGWPAAYVYDGYDEVKCLQRFPNLRSVALGFVWNARVLEPLRNVGKLEALRIHADKEVVIDLTPLLSLPRLTSLHLDGQFSPPWVLPQLHSLHCLQLCFHPLKDFLPAMERCRKLRRLCVESGEPERPFDFQHLADLQSLQAGWAGVPHLRALLPCQKLRHLELRGGEGVTAELAPLEGLPHLSHLLLHRCEARDCSVLSRLHGLRALYFPHNATDEDLRAVASACRGLEMVSVALCPGITDLSSLKHLPKLRDLGLSFSERVPDLGFLRHLSRLESLSLTELGPGADLDALRSLKHLKHLSVSFSDEVKDLGVLEPLAELRTLRLSAAPNDMNFMRGLKKLVGLKCVLRRTKVNLRPLGELKDLTYLYLACGPVEDLWRPSPQSVLSELSLATGPMEDLSPLSKLDHLESLSIYLRHFVGGLGPLGELRKLEKLELTGCSRETDLSFLKGMPIRALEVHGEIDEAGEFCGVDLLWETLACATNLEHIEFYYVRFKGPPAPLGRLSSLFSMELSACRGLETAAPLASLPALEYLLIDACKMEDFRPLGRIPNLRVLHFSGMFPWSVDAAFLREARKLEYFGLGGLAPEDITPIVEFARRGGYVHTMDPEFDERLHRAIEAEEDQREGNAEPAPE